MSIIVISYNHDRFVLEALDSVRAQTLGGLELIIIDDCSTDRTRDLIAAWLIGSGLSAMFIANDTNIGFIRTLNRILPQARGEFVSLLAADDRLHPEKCERQSEVLRRQEIDTAVYSDATLIDAEGRVLAQSWLERFSPGPPRSGAVFRELLTGELRLPLQTVLVPRSLLRRVGPFDEHLVYEDRDFELRLGAAAALCFSDYPSADYRIVDTGMRLKTDEAAFFRSNVRIYAKWLDGDRSTRAIARRQMMTEAYRIRESCGGTLGELWAAVNQARYPGGFVLGVLATARVPRRSLVRLGALAASARRIISGRRR